MSSCFRSNKATGALLQYLQYRELLWNLVVRNLKVRYKNSSLGFFWTMLNPLFLIFIYYIFIRLMRFPMDLPQLLIGVIPWHFLSMTLSDSVEAISGNSTLITKVRFPRLVLPLSIVVANCINYLLSLCVLIACLPLLGCPWSWGMLWLFVLIPITFAFVLGLSLLVCTGNVYFKDTAHLLGLVLMAWLFLTPIIYPLSQIPERFRELIFLNPMTCLIEGYRAAFLETAMPFTPFLVLSVIFIFTALWLGLRFFLHFEPVFADEL